jgi:hypothetical protein
MFSINTKIILNIHGFFIPGICGTWNIALNLTQMNNKSYLHELDLARIYYYIKTGFYWNIYTKGGTAFQTASDIQYHQPIFIFTPYKITTKVICN